MARREVSDTFERGDPYERYVGRWSRQIAPRFLAWLGVPAGRRWLDVGCGTGALCAAILEQASPASVVGVEPSDGFLQAAKGNLRGRAVLRQGSAERIPLADASVDVSVSGLALNFVSDPRAGLAEMMRVTRRGGVIAAYVWDYAGKMELVRHFWDVAAELDPGAAALHEGARFPLCRPEALTELFASAGLKEVDVTSLDVQASFASFDDYWQPFLGGQGPAPAYAMSLDAAARERLRACLRARVPAAPTGAIALIARAWAVRGTSPGDAAADGIETRRASTADAVDVRRASTADGIVIRPATVADVDVLTNLAARTYRDAYASNHDPDQLERHIASNFTPARIRAEVGDPLCTVLLALARGEPVGYALLRRVPPPACVRSVSSIELSRIYLVQQMIGRGCGSALMQACLEEARRSGRETIWLGVWEENARALAFYEKWGFERVGTQEFVFGGTAYEDLVMARSIPVDA
ncbi:MAG: GNAT family N-acetyltransferase [bacterium]